ncbi:MAG: hypothetical protein QGH23_01190 [Dehalococcoidia bacterium]|jgi:hypothetical protein|nr:hypothetical protein [Dehalococcoidia bacterium]
MQKFQRGDRIRFKDEPSIDEELRAEYGQIDSLFHMSREYPEPHYWVIPEFSEQLDLIPESWMEPENP